MLVHGKGTRASQQEAEQRPDQDDVELDAMAPAWSQRPVHEESVGSMDQKDRDHEDRRTLEELAPQATEVLAAVLSRAGVTVDDERVA